MRIQASRQAERLFPRAVLRIAAVLFFLVLASPPRQARAKGDLNVVLIFVDALRPDHLHCAGYPRKTSPAIDSLAREGVLFANNFSTAPYTCASFMSIDTSLYPDSHGVKAVFRDRLSPRVKTLAQILRVYGYSTCWYGPAKNPHLLPEMGFASGFDDLLLFGDDTDGLKEMRGRLCDWISRHKGRRFFLNFHTGKVHAPYCPSPGYLKRFARSNWQPWFYDRKRIMSTCEAARPAGGEKLPGEVMGFIDYFSYWRIFQLNDPGSRRRMEDLYDAAIFEFDREVIAPVVATLKSLGIYEKTVIIVCSDHGDEFYEHGGVGHAVTVYDEVMRSALLIRVPGMKEPRVVTGLSQTVDILPTLLDLLEIPIPAQAQGVSWKEAFGPGWQPRPLREYVYGQNEDFIFIRSAEWKFIRHGRGSSELYRVSEDPGEKSEMSAREPQVAKRLEGELRKWEKELPSYRLEGLDFPAGMSEETRQRIKKTGYW